MLFHACCSSSSFDRVVAATSHALLASGSTSFAMIAMLDSTPRAAGDSVHNVLKESTLLPAPARSSCVLAARMPIQREPEHALSAQPASTPSQALASAYSAVGHLLDSGGKQGLSTLRGRQVRARIWRKSKYFSPKSVNSLVSHRMPVVGSISRMLSSWVII
jgi:hypothetical protein